ncbi:transthyretin-like [Gigantopelta aegis]|uniref:transthyretin-like n=1 Tax=Gigantopelta aegis TaxID=1735272 RepID=UPI001B88AB77|nr:transthyretin-like [Gigantopelta aegis]
MVTAEMKTFVTYVSMAEVSVKAPLTVQVRDMACGAAVSRLPVSLSKKDDTNQWETIEEGITTSDGVVSMMQTKSLKQDSLYKLRAQTSSYFGNMGSKSSFPFIEVVFEIDNDRPNIFILLNISPFGYNVTVEI